MTPNKETPETAWYLSPKWVLVAHLALCVTGGLWAAVLEAFSTPETRLTPGMGQVLWGVVFVLFWLSIWWVVVLLRWRKKLPERERFLRKRSIIWLVLFVAWSLFSVLGITTLNVGRNLFDTYVDKAVSADGRRVGFLYQTGLFGCSYEVWERPPWSLVIHRRATIPTRSAT